eukprot:Rhum_TRINITY_DN25070_c0_g1::Rhum_TRINITY_DN25070_c0_g1_i1::g.181094::m.181094
MSALLQLDENTPFLRTLEVTSTSSRKGAPTTALGFWTLVLIGANTMNGPGMLAFSRIFYDAGWVPSVATLVVAGLTTGGTVSLFTDVLEQDPGDVEYAALSLRVLGRSWQQITIVLLSVSLIMLACAQIVVTAQAMDAVVVGLFGSSAAVTYWPSPSLVTSDAVSLMPFPSGTFGVSIGFVVDAVLCVALGRLDLSDNILPQYVSVILEVTSVAVMLVYFATTASGSVPAFGDDWSALLGVAVFNFAFVIAVPSLFSDSDVAVDFRRSMWWSVGIMSCLPMAVGILGVLAADPGAPSANILQAMYSAEDSPFLVRLAALGYSVGLALPIPLYHILCKRNLALIMPKAVGDPLSIAAPWALACVCYMQPWFGLLINWSSLLCLGFINYSIPLFIAVSARQLGYLSLGRYHAANVALCVSTVAILGAIVQNLLSM